MSTTLASKYGRIREMIGAITFRPELAALYGLAGGHLRDLRDVVLLTGPNGGGKTRYLQLLIQEWALHRKLMQRQQALKTFTELRAAARAGMLREEDVQGHGNDLLYALYAYVSHSGLLHSDTSPSPAGAALPSAQRVIEDIGALTSNISLHPNRVYRAVERQELPRTVLLKYYKSSYKNYYRSLDGGDLCREESGLKKEDYFEAERRRVRMYQTRQKLPQHLSQLARIIYLGEHPGFQQSHARELADARALWELLGALLKAPLRVDDFDLGRDEPKLAVGGRPFAVEELSEGQQVLLTWGLTIHESAGALTNAIVLLDEPELHLHPSATIEAVENLRTRGASQIFVATHSPAVLAHFGVDGLYYVHDGRIEYAGNKVERVLGGLLGEQGREDLRTFLADADALSLYNFAAQSLLAPDSVGLQAGDPQAAQFCGLLAGLGGERPVHVLDYAAGKGRLARALAEQGRPDGLLYHAYNDPRFITEEDSAACRRNIDALRQGEGAYYVERFEALTLSTAPRMNAVVLCNVLHEIPETDWLATFRRISDVLTDDGVLLLMEDQCMTRGELPHRGGFIVLDDLALAELFVLPPGALHNLDPTGSERLTIFRIPRAALQSAHPGTLRRALRKLEETTLTRLRRLRDRTAMDHRQGREHAYLAMLLCNVVLALEATPGVAVGLVDRPRRQGERTSELNRQPLLICSARPRQAPARDPPTVIRPGEGADAGPTRRCSGRRPRPHPRGPRVVQSSAVRRATSCPKGHVIIRAARSPLDRGCGPWYGRRGGERMRGRRILLCIFGLVGCADDPATTTETAATTVTDATTQATSQQTSEPTSTSENSETTTMATTPTTGPEVTGSSTDETDPTTGATDSGGTTTGEPLTGMPFVYVSGYDPKIRVYRLDAETGALSEAVAPVDGGNNPSYLAFTPSRRYLYALREGDGNNGVAAYAIDPASGGLTFLNEVDSEGQGPAHIATDATGAWVMVANYGGGTIAVFGTNPDGSLAGAAAVESHGDGSQPHQIVPDLDNTHVIVANKGRDDIFVYPFDASNGELGEPAITKLADGSGPRHVAVHPGGTYVYAINELSSTITGFTYARGALAEIETVSSLPQGFNGDNTGAEIQLDPAGKFLYASNRGHDSVVVHAVDPASGKLTIVEHEPTQGSTPRGFHLDESGAHLFVANQNSGNVVGFAVDAVTGSLTPTGVTEQANSPSFVGVIYLPGR
ncbi:beta-propeller fold lactonase family protein [Nannocystis pusilla]|uniref:beta-propeller fold lactonase family protein n=1 Tax=Nannocystis pusilla TaxID=889268 RepID=UPI003DA547DE